MPGVARAPFARLCTPVDRAVYPADWRGATLFSRDPEALEHTAHGGNADPDAGGGRNAGAESLQGAIGLSMYYALEHGLGSSIKPGLLASVWWFGSKLAGRAIAAEHLLHKRGTNTERIRQGALRAKAMLVGLD
jgi:hypothetical protein